MKKFHFPFEKAKTIELWPRECIKRNENEIFQSIKNRFETSENAQTRTKINQSLLIRCRAHIRMLADAVYVRRKCPCEHEYTPSTDIP